MKLLIAIAVAGVLLAAAACGQPASGASAKHEAASKLITSRAHVAGSGGPERWFLTLKGKHQPVSVSKATYKHCQIGERYPTCG